MFNLIKNLFAAVVRAWSTYWAIRGIRRLGVQGPHRTAIKLQRAGLPLGEVKKIFATRSLRSLRGQWTPKKIEQFRRILRDDGLYFKK